MNVTVEIPQSWLERHAEFGNGVHLSHEELDAIQVGEGEWDSEYSQIVNALFPFDSCVLHAGGDGWGRNAASYGDVQMRLYFVEVSPAQVVERVVSVGSAEASKISTTTVERRKDFAGWRRATLTYPLWYDDYGGEANIDVFARAIGSRTAVLVFMYAIAHEVRLREVEGIVKSFQWESER